MREWERCGAGSWSSRCSGSSIGAAIVASFLRQRHNARDVQVPHHKAGYIQAAAVLDVFGVHVVSGPRDLQCELVGGAEEPAPMITDLHVDAEPLAPLAVDLADVDHAGKYRAIRLLRRRWLWILGRAGRGLLPVEFQERAHDFLLELQNLQGLLFDLAV